MEMSRADWDPGGAGFFCFSPYVEKYELISLAPQEKLAVFLMLGSGRERRECCQTEPNFISLMF